MQQVKTAPLLTGLSILVLGVTLILQASKNREFRFRISQLEAQIVEIKLRLDIHELPFPRRMDTFVIQPELQLDPPVPINPLPK